MLFGNSNFFKVGFWFVFMGNVKGNLIDKKRINCVVLEKKFGFSKKIKLELRVLEAFLGDFRFSAKASCGNFSACKENSYGKECLCYLGHEEIRKEYFPDYGTLGVKPLGVGYFDFLKRKIK